MAKKPIRSKPFFSLLCCISFCRYHRTSVEKWRFTVCPCVANSVSKTKAANMLSSKDAIPLWNCGNHKNPSVLLNVSSLKASFNNSNFAVLPSLQQNLMYTFSSFKSNIFLIMKIIESTTHDLTS